MHARLAIMNTPFPSPTAIGPSHTHPTIKMSTVGCQSLAVAALEHLRVEQQQSKASLQVELLYGEAEEGNATFKCWELRFLEQIIL